jgi:hypothetical protein
MPTGVSTLGRVTISSEHPRPIRANARARMVAVEGRAPRGTGIARLSDQPAQWSRQHIEFGLIES